MTQSVIAFTGQPGHGKDTCADYLVKTYGFTKIAFADLLYAEAAAAFRVEVPYLKTREIKEQPQKILSLDHCNSFDFRQYLLAHVPELGLAQVRIQSKREMLLEPRSPRWILQRWGDYRRHTDKLYFIRHVGREIGGNPDKSYAISDLRYQLELESLTRWLAAHVFFVHDPRQPEGDNHSSNVDLRAIEPYLNQIQNGGSFEDLYEQIEWWLAMLGRPDKN